MIATWDDAPGACPVDASALVTYSQSDDVTSPHLADQTREFSAKRFIPMRFCEADILADPELTTTKVTSRGGAGPRSASELQPTPVAPPGDRLAGTHGSGDAAAGGREATTSPAGRRSPLPRTGLAMPVLLALALLGGSFALRTKTRRRTAR
ncbi:hypothetical protein BH20ACT2_BH20ACT2_04860 [soil metagenome]